MLKAVVVSSLLLVLTACGSPVSEEPINVEDIPNQNIQVIKVEPCRGE